MLLFYVPVFLGTCRQFHAPDRHRARNPSWPVKPYYIYSICMSREYIKLIILEVIFATELHTSLVKTGGNFEIHRN